MVKVDVDFSLLLPKCISTRRPHFIFRMLMQNPGLAFKRDIERFIWNFLASRTGTGLVASNAGKLCF